MPPSRAWWCVKASRFGLVRLDIAIMTHILNCRAVALTLMIREMLLLFLWLANWCCIIRLYYRKIWLKSRSRAKFKSMQLYSRIQWSYFLGIRLGYRSFESRAQTDKEFSVQILSNAIFSSILIGCSKISTNQKA